MFKIGEFSKITQVSIRMLRYYDEQDLLQPNAIDPSNGYRMYSANQIEDLNKIVLLRNLGFNVKEMKEILHQWDANQLKEDLVKQIERTKILIKTEEDRLKQIQGYLKDLENQNTKLNIQIIMKQIPTTHVVSIRKVVDNYFCEGELWQELGKRIQGIEHIDSQKSFSIYHDLDHREEQVDIEVCVEVRTPYDYQDNGLIYRQVQGIDKAACFMIYGPYSNISIAYKEFAYWLEQHLEYRMAGENRQICHVSMCHTSNPEEYITELQIPLIDTEVKSIEPYYEK